MPFSFARHAGIMVQDSEREAFVRRVKAIDSVFTSGKIEETLRLLPELMSMGPGRRDLSQRKSHYLASLALRSLSRGDSASALTFLDLADVHVRDDHLTPFLRNERLEFREQAQRGRKAT